MNTPKIYVLAGYASNEHDHALLEDADVRADLAEAIVAAVQRLFLTEQNDYDTGTLDLSNVPWASRSYDSATALTGNRTGRHRVGPAFSIALF